MNEPMPTPCPEWEEQLAAQNLDTLSAAEREALELHLQTCTACAAVLADYLRMDLLIDQALRSDLPLELPENFAARRQWHGAEQQPAISEENEEQRQREGFPPHPSRQMMIAHCRLQRMVEKGHLTSSYLADHVHLRKPVIVKLHHRQLSDNEKQRFHQQATKIANLSHPNIVRVLDFGIHEEQPFLVMEHVHKSSLRDVHPRGLPVPLPTIVSYVKKIADALQYAHERKIIHRNLRPENIFVGPENQILLADFGIPALQSNGSSFPHPATGAHFYMAPEQFHGKHHRASDQYAIAVMVYEWLSGERPFYGSVTEIAKKHRELPPPPLHTKVPALSPTVEQVVLKALAKKPQMRFKNVQEFATALEEASSY